MNKELVLIGFLSLAILSSGCVQGDKPEIEVSQEEILIEANQSTELGFRVKNNYNYTSSFNITLEPQKTQREYIQILDEGKRKTKFDLGDARKDSYTSWKYVNVKSSLESIDPSAIAVKLHLYAYQKGKNQPIDNQTVSVTITE